MRLDRLRQLPSDQIAGARERVFIEVAYFLDYGTKRKDYITQWFNNLDWAWVNEQVKRYNLLEHRQRHNIGKA